jgi:alpha/beta superfamily hydrolase
MTTVRTIAGPAGRLEVLLTDASTGAPHTAVVFGHPHPLHGGTMHTKVVFRATKALASEGCAVLRFNFRGVGRSEGTFGDGIGEVEDFHAALTFMHTQYPGASLWAAGMSFGAWVALTAGAADNRVETLLGLAPPADRYDFAALKGTTKPKFIIHAEQDEVCPLSAVQHLVAELPEPKQLFVIPGAQHLFLERLDAVADTVRTIVAGRATPHA